MPVIQALHIRQNRLLATAQRAQVGRCHGAVAAVAHSHYQHVHGVIGVYGLQLDAIFMADFVRVGDRVADDDLHAPAFKFAHHVHDLAVADVGAVFLEGDAENADLAARGVHALLQHQLDGISRHVARHVVVDAAAGQNDLRVVADGLGLVGEVVGIDANAMAADQAGAEGQEVPFAAGGFEHFYRVDAEAGEEDGEFVDEGDVEVALGVFDDLGGFCDLDAAGGVGAGGDDAGVEGIDGLGGGCGAAAGDFLDLGEGVDLVAGVDALGAVAAIEALGRIGIGLVATVDVAQAGGFFQFGDADFFGGAGVDGGFVDDDVARLEHASNGLAGLDEWGQVRLHGVIDRGGDGDDEDAAVAQVGGLAGVAQLAGGLELFGRGFECGVVALAQFVNAMRVDVEADNRANAAKFHGQREADVA